MHPMQNFARANFGSELGPRPVVELHDFNAVVLASSKSTEVGESVPGCAQGNTFSYARVHCETLDLLGCLYLYTHACMCA